MDSIKIKARAKINLGLDVLGRRDNGYHDVRMVMQTVGLYDSLTMKRIDGEDIVIRSNLSFLPVNENNLIYKAIRLMKDNYKLDGGVDVDLVKFIPVAAGMAGGSSDAASAIYGMNKLYDLKLSVEDMMKLGVNIGADVPFCIMRRTALAEGIGEKLTRLSPMPDCSIVVAKPAINVSTKLVYEKLDSTDISRHPDIDGIIEALDRHNINLLAKRMGNVLEDVTIPTYPVIDSIKQDMLERGAINAMMSGSGPTVFGIFDNEADAYACRDYLKDKGEAKQTFVTENF